MNIVVIGLGSMGRRRIRLIKQYNDSYKIIGVDLNKERRIASESEFGIETIDSLEEAIKNNSLDSAIICTSPLSHSKLIKLCLENNLHVFTELNLVTDGYDENIQLAEEKNKVLFLSSTFLHRAEINQIKKLVKMQDERLNYNYHIGQYLPDWHPWENYKDFFVGDKRTNGCREIFAIELPWLIEVFGNVKDIIVRKSRISSLNIDYDDNYMVILEHESGHKGMLAVDIVSRKAVRNLEVFGENLYLSWDGSAEGLKMMDIEKRIEANILLYEKIDQLNQYSKFVVENAYYDEIVFFFNVISNNIEPIYDFEKDKIILDLIDRIEA
ncbi:Gfo/Idh/MocA family oxidoreductase [Bacteroides sp.]|uniref:Gfo/Idh/MocA family protein n=1 Tax=Bacteroides sp. TaxID=29523 RepID=UPI00261DB42C|nr:Gfo/Idh/MocA family oxidoreductase [Bacteroides sp.]MDD3040953.1 Gfo/Idh/MocA family oxidoreductase [Bacteroides sp.]